MTKANGHLVTFAAASNLEEAKPGYSEINTGLPSGTCIHQRTAKDKNGESYLLIPDPDGYEERKVRWTQEKKGVHPFPDWAISIFESIKGYQGLCIGEQMCMIEKIMDRFDRNQTAQKVREAKTKQEAMEILEDFHREGHAHRKITALNLNCMKEVREIRRREALRSR